MRKNIKNKFVVYFICAAFIISSCSTKPYVRKNDPIKVKDKKDSTDGEKVNNNTKKYNKALIGAGIGCLLGIVIGIPLALGGGGGTNDDEQSTGRGDAGGGGTGGGIGFALIPILGIAGGLIGLGVDAVSGKKKKAEENKNKKIKIIFRDKQKPKEGKKGEENKESEESKNAKEEEIKND